MRTLLVYVLLSGTVSADITPYDAFSFLVRYLPTMDQQRDPTITTAWLNLNVELALEVRYSRFPWASVVPEELFLNDVLPYSFLTEPRDVPWRPMFFAHIFLNQNLDQQSHLRSNMSAFVEWANQNAWKMRNPPLHYAPSQTNGINQYSAWEALKNGNASCTGLAQFLGGFLRTAGVPARIVGTPHWNRGAAVCPNGDADDDCGNHNWLEAWILDDNVAAAAAATASAASRDPSNSSTSSMNPRGRWVVLSPGDGAGFNEGWFLPYPAAYQVPATTNHSIFATSYAPPEVSRTTQYDPLARRSVAGRFPLVWAWNDHSIHATDVTATGRYGAPAA